MGEEEKVRAKKVPEPPEDWRADGLGVQDVCREVLEEALSNGLLTEECLATEKAMVVELDGFQEILDGAPQEEPAETEMVAPELDRSSDVESSGDEFYLEGFLRASKTVRLGALLTSLPRMIAWFQDAGRRLVASSLSELMRPLSAKRPSVPSGRASGCIKLCSTVKEKEVDGVKVLSRCSRRCDRGCPRLGGFGDTDERVHRCYVHEEEEVRAED